MKPKKTPDEVYRKILDDAVLSKLNSKDKKLQAAVLLYDDVDTILYKKK